MTGRQIHDVNIITHAGTVGSGIIITVHRHGFQLTNRDLGDVRNQIIGDTVRILTNPTRWMGADRVEIAQAGNAEIGLCTREVSQNLFDHQLRRAVRIGGAARTRLLAKRYAFRITIYRGG